MNNAINEMKSSLEGTNSRIAHAEDRISEMEYRMVEINEAERKKETDIQIQEAQRVPDRINLRRNT